MLKVRNFLLIDILAISEVTEIIVVLTLITLLVLFEYVRQTSTSSKNSKTVRRTIGTFVLLNCMLVLFLVVRRVFIFTS